MLRSRKFALMALSLGVALLAAPARAAEIDKLTPADAQAVMVFNVHQAINSPLAKKKMVANILKSGIEGNPEAKKVLTALGLDLTKDIETVSVSVGDLDELQEGKKPEKMLITIRGTFDPEKIDAAVKGADTIKVSKEGNVTVYEVKDKGKGDTNYITLIGKNVVAASPSKEYLLKSVKNIGGGSKDLVKAGAKIDGKHSMWMAVVIDEGMRKKMAQSPQFKDIAPKLESVTTSVNITSDIVLDVNVNTTNAAAAKDMKKQIDAALPFLTAFIGDDNPASPVVKDLMKSLKVTAGPDALNINLKVTEETLDKIIKLAGGLK